MLAREVNGAGLTNFVPLSSYFQVPDDGSAMFHRTVNIIEQGSSFNNFNVDEGNSDNASFQNLAIDWTSSVVHDSGRLSLVHSSQGEPFQ